MELVDKYLLRIEDRKDYHYIVNRLDFEEVEDSFKKISELTNVLNEEVINILSRDNEKQTIVVWIFSGADLSEATWLELIEEEKQK